MQTLRGYRSPASPSRAELPTTGGEQRREKGEGEQQKSHPLHTLTNMTQVTHGHVTTQVYKNKTEVDTHFLNKHAEKRPLFLSRSHVSALSLYKKSVSAIVN